MKVFPNWQALTVTPPVVPDRRWKTLKKDGHKRCCAVFNNGRRCRRHVADKDAPMGDQRSGFCSRHARVMAAAIAPLKKKGLI